MSHTAKFWANTIITARVTDIGILFLLMSSEYSDVIKSYIVNAIEHTNVDYALEVLSFYAEYNF